MNKQLLWNVEKNIATFIEIDEVLIAIVRTDFGLSLLFLIY